MKTTALTIILTCIYGLTYGQVKTIKVKKPTKQSEMTSVVTWCGLYYGKVTVANMLADNKLKISNNKENIRIISSDITFFIKGVGTHNISQPGDSLSKLAIDEILKLDAEKNTLIFISSIKAVTKNQDTIYLNPIDLKLSKE